MALGTFNPKDDTRTSSIREAHVLTGANVRKWFDTVLNTRPKAQDLNLILAQFYAAGDYYGVADTEGNDNYLLSMFQSIVDNAEWTVSGASGTADISTKRGLRGSLTAGASTGVTSFGAVQAGKTFLVYYNNATPRAVLPGATIQTPNNLPVYLQQGDSFFLIGASDGVKYRLYPVLTNLFDEAETIALNGDFEHWQRGTSFTLAANTTTFLADGWKGRRAATGMEVSQQAGFSGNRYCTRVKRTTGDTSTSPLILGFQIPSNIAQQLAGKPVLVSYDLRLGADAVTAIGAGASIAPAWSNGAGYDESPSLVNGAFGTPNGAAQSATFAGGYTASTTATRVVSNPFICTALTTESLMRLIYTPIATAAGAAEYFEIANVRIQVGQLPTPFLAESRAKAISRIQARFRKSFAMTTTPAAAVGAGTGIRAVCTLAGAVVQFVAHVTFENEMASIPAVTIYNPVTAASSQVRNITRSTDGTSTTVQNITTRGFDVICTGAAGWVVGDTLEFHYAAEAGL